MNKEFYLNKEFDYRYWKKKTFQWKISALLGLFATFFLFFILVGIYPIEVVSMRENTNYIGYSNFINENVFFDENFTDAEKRELRDIFYDLKPEYIAISSKITFTKDRDKLGNLSNKCKSGGCTGLNYWDDLFDSKAILILYNDRPNWKIRRTVCHEILHNLIKGGSDKRHAIVYDLADEGVCYKDETRRLF